MAAPDAANPFDLTGKVALVTGGNGGIGLGMALALGRAGADLVIAGRDRAKNDAARKTLADTGRQAHALAADLADAAACRAMVDEAAARFGRLDILVNSAGMNIRRKPQDYAVEEWQAVLTTNLTSAFVACQAAHPAMLRAGAGKIINIGSMMSLFGNGMVAAYAASKGGIVQMTKALASAWAADNIQVNAVLPGWIDTDLTRAARRDLHGLHERMLARTPAARWGTPADMGGIAVFLASAASDFVTGAAIPVDGGYSAHG